jgi:DNA-binding response OmpR family regulator
MRDGPHKRKPNISMTQLHLTTKEAQVLQFLEQNSGRILSRDTLLKRVWGYADGVVSRTVDVHIQRLRRKLKGNLELKIHTIFGQGYVLELPGLHGESNAQPQQNKTRLQRVTRSADE